MEYFNLTISYVLKNWILSAEETEISKEYK